MRPRLKEDLQAAKERALGAARRSVVALYVVEAHYPELTPSNPWVELAQGSRDWCLGFLDARRATTPRPACRVRRVADDRVIADLPGSSEAAFGILAGGPSPAQLLTAAVRCLRLFLGPFELPLPPAEEDRAWAEETLRRLEELDRYRDVLDPGESHGARRGPG